MNIASYILTASVILSSTPSFGSSLSLDSIASGSFALATTSITYIIGKIPSIPHVPTQTKPQATRTTDMITQKLPPTQAAGRERMPEPFVESSTKKPAPSSPSKLQTVLKDFFLAAAQPIGMLALRFILDAFDGKLDGESPLGKIDYQLPLEKVVLTAVNQLQAAQH
jgi:hypothetical protein